MPEPIFASPRNLSRIFHEQVKRRWFQPTQIVERRGIPPLPPAPTIVFLDLDFSPGVWTSVTNKNIGAATFDVVRTDCSFPAPDGVVVTYKFRMSDGSTQQVSATVRTDSDPDWIIAANVWRPGDLTTVGPAMMDNPAGSWTHTTFGEGHWIYLWGPSGSGPATITITISVPGRPDIAPLVITCTARNL
jgi:hypothetical protein